jgi:hypothetical protein
MRLAYPEFSPVMASTYHALPTRITGGGVNVAPGFHDDPSPVREIPCRAAPRERVRRSGAGAAVSLSPREEEALASIGDQLTRTDPDLAAFLASFSRLAEGEHMPLREAVRRRSHRLARRRHCAKKHSRRQFGHRPFQRLGIGPAAALLWVVISVMLITIAITFNSRGGSRTDCTEEALTVVCASSVPSHTSSPARLGSGDRAYSPAGKPATGKTARTGQVPA